MSNQDDLRAIAGKALADPEFRKKLLEDPQAAVKEAGIELNEEQVKALEEMDREQFEQELGDLDQRLTMSCWGRAPAESLPIPLLKPDDPFGGDLPLDKPSAESLPIPMPKPKLWG
jgi:hypothetical protein